MDLKIIDLKNISIDNIIHKTKRVIGYVISSKIKATKVLSRKFKFVLDQQNIYPIEKEIQKVNNLKDLLSYSSISFSSFFTSSSISLSNSSKYSSLAVIVISMSILPYFIALVSFISYYI